MAPCVQLSGRVSSARSRRRWSIFLHHRCSQEVLFACAAGNCLDVKEAATVPRYRGQATGRRPYRAAPVTVGFALKRTALITPWTNVSCPPLVSAPETQRRVVVIQQMALPLSAERSDA